MNGIYRLVDKYRRNEGCGDTLNKALRVDTMWLDLHNIIDSNLKGMLWGNTQVT